MRRRFSASAVRPRADSDKYHAHSQSARRDYKVRRTVSSGTVRRAGLRGVCAGHAEHPTQGVYVDRSIFGGAAQRGVVKCTACGSPWIFDLDISIPANMAPGVKTFAVAAIYRDGSRVETTASIEISNCETCR